jgi:hypothetical protein
MPHEDREVPTGALAAALEMVEVLHGRDGEAAPNQVMDRLMQGLKIWGRPVVTEAFGTIIYVAAQQLRPAPDDPGAADLKMSVVAAVLNRLRRDFPEVPAKQLPIVAGMLTAAVLGIGPYDWRVSLGPVDPDEHLAWCYTACLLVDLVDSTIEHPGAFAETLRAALNSDTQ